MVRYTLCQKIVMPGGTPVYEQDGGENYLYLSEYGNWSVGPVAGDRNNSFLCQDIDQSPSPDKTITWEYYSGGWKVDNTLKVYPCFY